MRISIWGKARLASPRKAALYAGFIATGAAFTIPGAALPLLLLQWSMSDARGGLLLFCFYSLGILGAYSARGRMHLSLARGALLTSIGAFCLSWAGRWSAYPAIALYGFGLSLTMTSISLLVSQRFPQQRRIEMMRLNLVWAFGAAMGPWIALSSTQLTPISRHGGVRSTVQAAGRGAALSANSLHHLQHVLGGVTLFFILAAAWATWIEDSEKPEASNAATVVTGAPQRSPAESSPSQLARSHFGVPWTLLALVFGAVGVETAASSWLTAYAQRAGDSLGITIGAATFLWGGSLLSRIFHSTAWVSRLSERNILVSSILAMVTSLALLIAWPAGVVTLLAAGILGLATGPVYPMLLAVALRHRESSLAFTIAALGSSLLPLATGSVSSWAHSLRSGLSIPLLVATSMAVLIFASRNIFESKQENIPAEMLG
ncbi:MAG: MFS transporter [Acidobacteriaceae bacterium]